MDIAKYTMTAVILTSIFGEFSQKRTGETCPFLFTLSYAVAAAMRKMIIPIITIARNIIAARGLFVKVGVRTWYFFILLGISVLQIAFVRTPEFICRTTNKGILYLVVCQYLA